MRTKEIKVNLLNQIYQELIQDGFKLVKTQEWFIRKNKTRDFIFWIVFYPETNKIRVTPTVAVRFPQVEDIFHNAFETPMQYRRFTHTVVSEIWRWLGQENTYQYLIEAKSDIDEVSNKIVYNFKNEANKFFQYCSSLEKIDLLLNSQPSQDSVYQLMDHARCSRGIIVAKLCNRKNYPELSTLYRERMIKQDNGFYLNSFDKLLKILSEIG